MIKVLSCILLQCLGPVKILTAEGCSETGDAMHLSNHVFRTQKFRQYLSYEAQLFFRYMLQI